MTGTPRATGDGSAGREAADAESGERGTPVWWAKGLLFENCNCTAVCAGHVHFSQPCTHDVCHGFWTIRIREGAVGQVPLAGVDAVVIYEAPQVMIDGGWREVILISEQATDDQAEAVEALLSGALGGPWAVLGRFVEERLPTRRVPISIEDGPTVKRVGIPGLLEGVVEAIRGRDRGAPVTFENIYNQIHAPTQVIARGATTYDDGAVRIRTEGTHGLWSHFSWNP